MSICMCVHIYIYVYVYIYVFIYIYTHIYTHSLKARETRPASPDGCSQVTVLNTRASCTW